MSSRKKIQAKKTSTQPVNKSMTDQQFENTLAEEFPEIPLSITKPRVTAAGISNKQKKRKSGAREILDGIKKRQTSGKMLDKQLEFTTKLAQFEEVRDELEAAKAEAGVSYLCKVPKPADWVRNPSRQPHWSTRGAKNVGFNDALSVGSDEYEAFKKTEHLARLPKLADCMKHMNIEVHPQLLKEWYMETLPTEARLHGVRIVQDPALCQRTIAISRTVPRELTTDPKQMLKLSEVRENSLRYIYCMSGGGDGGGGGAGGARSRLEEAAARAHALHGQLTLVEFHSENCFQSKKTDLDMAITDLLVSLEIDTVIVKSAEELVTLILQFTKALAEEPIKLAKRAVDEEADFYMRGDNKNCVSVDQQGNGLARLWQQMLGVLPQSSLEVSRAIAAEYNSPSRLAEAVSSEGGVLRLADVGVSRSTVPGAKPRRLGTEMANKLQILFNTIDGNVRIE